MPGCAVVCRYAPNDYAPSRIYLIFALVNNTDLW